MFWRELEEAWRRLKIRRGQSEMMMLLLEKWVADGDRG